jgi:hypothetical protein
VAPAGLALVFYRENWFRAYIILLMTMLVDLDHLLANPVFAPCRCSIGFHPLHSYGAIAAYMIMFFFPKTRLVAIGLLMHIATDGIDCWMSSYYCH